MPTPVVQRARSPTRILEPLPFALGVGAPAPALRATPVAAASKLAAQSDDDYSAMRASVEALALQLVRWDGVVDAIEGGVDAMLARSVAVAQAAEVGRTEAEETLRAALDEFRCEAEAEQLLMLAKANEVHAEELDARRTDAGTTLRVALDELRCETEAEQLLVLNKANEVHASEIDACRAHAEAVARAALDELCSAMGAEQRVALAAAKEVHTNEINRRDALEKRDKVKRAAAAARNRESAASEAATAARAASDVLAAMQCELEGQLRARDDSLATLEASLEAARLGGDAEMHSLRATLAAAKSSAASAVSALSAHESSYADEFKRRDAQIQSGKARRAAAATSAAEAAAAEAAAANIAAEEALAAVQGELAARDASIKSLNSTMAVARVKGDAELEALRATLVTSGMAAATAEEELSASGIAHAAELSLRAVAEVEARNEAASELTAANTAAVAALDAVQKELKGQLRARDESLATLGATLEAALSGGDAELRSLRATLSASEIAAAVSANELRTSAAALVKVEAAHAETAKRAAAAAKEHEESSTRFNSTKAAAAVALTGVRNELEGELRAHKEAMASLEATLAAARSDSKSEVAKMREMVASVTAAASASAASELAAFGETMKNTELSHADALARWNALNASELSACRESCAAEAAARVAKGLRMEAELQESARAVERVRNEFDAARRAARAAEARAASTTEVAAQHSAKLDGAMAELEALRTQDLLAQREAAAARHALKAEHREWSVIVAAQHAASLTSRNAERAALAAEHADALGVVIKRAFALQESVSSLQAEHGEAKAAVTSMLAAAEEQRRASLAQVEANSKTSSAALTKQLQRSRDEHNDELDAQRALAAEQAAVLEVQVALIEAKQRAYREAAEVDLSTARAAHLHELEAASVRMAVAANNELEHVRAEHAVVLAEHRRAAVEREITLEARLAQMEDVQRARIDELKAASVVALSSAAAGLKMALAESVAENDALRSAHQRVQRGSIAELQSVAMAREAVREAQQLSQLEEMRWAHSVELKGVHASAHDAAAVELKTVCATHANELQRNRGVALEQEAALKARLAEVKANHHARVSEISTAHTHELSQQRDAMASELAGLRATHSHAIGELRVVAYASHQSRQETVMDLHFIQNQLRLHAIALEQSECAAADTASALQARIRSEEETSAAKHAAHAAAEEAHFAALAKLDAAYVAHAEELRNAAAEFNAHSESFKATLQAAHAAECADIQRKAVEQLAQVRVDLAEHHEDSKKSEAQVKENHCRKLEGRLAGAIAEKNALVTSTQQEMRALFSQLEALKGAARKSKKMQQRRNAAYTKSAKVQVAKLSGLAERAGAAETLLNELKQRDLALETSVELHEAIDREHAAEMSSLKESHAAERKASNSAMKSLVAAHASELARVVEQQQSEAAGIESQSAAIIALQEIIAETPQKLNRSAAAIESHSAAIIALEKRVAHAEAYAKVHQKSIAETPATLSVRRWKEKIQRKSGRTYWVHLDTKQSTWKHPGDGLVLAGAEAAAVATPTAKSTRVWQKKVSKKNGRSYYVNIVTKKSSWVHPGDDVMLVEARQKERRSTTVKRVWKRKHDERTTPRYTTPTKSTPKVKSTGVVRKL